MAAGVSRVEKRHGFEPWRAPHAGSIDGSIARLSHRGSCRDGSSATSRQVPAMAKMAKWEKDGRVAAWVVRTSSGILAVGSEYASWRRVVCTVRIIASRFECPGPRGDHKTEQFHHFQVNSSKVASHLLLPPHL